MTRNNRILLFIIFAVIAGLLTASYFLYIKPYMPKYKWHTSYYYNDDEPYGTEILYKSLKASHSGNDFTLIKQSFTKQFNWKGKNNCYIFIGGNYRIKENEADSLFRFVEQGNTAFISSTYIPREITSKLFPEEEEEIYDYEETVQEQEAVTDTEVSDTESVVVQTVESQTNDSLDFPTDNSMQKYLPHKMVTVHFLDSSSTNKTYSFHHQYLKDTVEYTFNFFNAYALKDATCSYESISYIDSVQNINYIAFRYGKGTLYLHTNPLFFTNYFLASPQGFDYANNTFHFIGKNNIYWDEIHKPGNFTENEYNYQNNTPFRYLLSQKSFRWAWYTLLAALALFLIFGSKRKQKAIPLMSVDKNSSLAYVRAVAAMYYQARSHFDIVYEMWHLFSVFVKIKYGIDLKTKEEQKLEELSKLSKVELPLLEEIVRLKNELTKAGNNSNSLLKTLEQLLTEFYKKTK